jgi:hypothetical protein
MLPSIKDLAMYVNKKLTELDWNNNFQKIVNWLTAGNTDVKFKSVEISQDGGLINNGSLTQSGDLSVTGNISTNGNLNVDGIITGDGSGLTGVVSSAQVSYTPFTVNSGNTDVNGKGDLFDYTADVSTSIQFKVGGSYKSITFTNAKGKTTTLDSINSYDLSQTDNGTYLVYLTENATAVTLSDNGAKIYRQPTAPASPSATDIWLDTSTEGLKSYIRQSGTWVESDIVPLGVVVVNNQKMQSATTYVYNWNGYNVNLDCASLQSNEKPRVVVKSYKSSKSYYRLYSDGWIEQGNYSNANSSVTFLVQMKNVNYNIKSANPSGYNESPKFYNLSTTGMTIANAGGSGAECWWEISGFIDTSVYNA